ncbi:MAG: DUF433 domain-containing protein [Granulosicoccaceae bacterium]
MNTQTDDDQPIAAPQPLVRITRDPQVMQGKACIRGMRVTVGMIVGQIGAGRSIEEVLADFPYLEREDILEALQYAAWLSQQREIVLAAG